MTLSLSHYVPLADPCSPKSPSRFRSTSPSAFLPIQPTHTSPPPCSENAAPLESRETASKANINCTIPVAVRPLKGTPPQPRGTMGRDISPDRLKEPPEEAPSTAIHDDSARHQQSSGQVLPGVGKGVGKGFGRMMRRVHSHGPASSPGLFDRSERVLTMGARWRTRGSRDVVDEPSGAVEDGDAGICRPFSVEVKY